MAHRVDVVTCHFASYSAEPIVTQSDAAFFARVCSARRGARHAVWITSRFPRLPRRPCFKT